MQALKKLEHKKDEMVEDAKEMLQPSPENPATLDTVEKWKEDAKEFAEDVVESVNDTIDEVIMPEAERIVSTMNRRYSYPKLRRFLDFYH